MKRVTILFVVLISMVININAQSDNKSLLFDGISQIVTIPDDASYHIGLGAFTVEGWIKAKTTQPVLYPMMISKRSSGDAFSGFMFGIDNQGKVWAQLDGVNFSSYGANLKDNVCHHIALSRCKGTTKDTLKYYLDGLLLNALPIGNTYNITTTGPFYIGGDLANPSNHMFKGNINEVRVWNYARSDEEIFDNRETQIDGNIPGLIGYWRLNEGSGQTIIDYSLEANDGYLGSSALDTDDDPDFSTSCAINISDASINEISRDNQIEVYPNPVTDRIRLENKSHNKITQVQLFDYSGQLIPVKISNNEINVSNLSKGIYFIKVINDKESFVKRVVLN